MAFNISELENLKREYKIFRKDRIVFRENVRMVITICIFATIGFMDSMAKYDSLHSLYSLLNSNYNSDSYFSGEPQTQITTTQQQPVEQTPPVQTNVENTNTTNDTNNYNNGVDSDLQELDEVYSEVMYYGNEDYFYNYTKDELALIRNTFYAKKGYIFKKEHWRNYFNSKDWYVGTTSDPYLTKEELEFIKRLKEAEDSYY